MTFSKISIPNNILQAISIPIEIRPKGIQYAITFKSVIRKIKLPKTLNYNKVILIL